MKFAGFSIITKLYGIMRINFRTFSSLEKETRTHWQSRCFPPLPVHPASVITSPFSVSLDGPALDLSYKRNQTICDLLRLAPVT